MKQKHCYNFFLTYFTSFKSDFSAEYTLCSTNSKIITLRYWQLILLLLLKCPRDKCSVPINIVNKIKSKRSDSMTQRLNLHDSIIIHTHAHHMMSLTQNNGSSSSYWNASTFNQFDTSMWCARNEASFCIYCCSTFIQCM